MARKERKHSQNVFERNGIRVKQVGKSIEWSSHRTPEEHAIFKRELWKARPQIVASIRGAVQELNGLIQKYTSFDLVANLWLKNGVFNPETYREWDAPQRPHHIEYASLLELKSNDVRRTAELVVDGKDVARSDEIMEQILQDTMWYHIACNADPRNGPGTEALRRAEFFGMFRYLVVGPPAYAKHWEDVLDGIFGWPELQVELSAALGVTYKDIRSLVDAVGSRMGKQIVDRFRDAREEKARLEADLDRYMSTGRYDGPADARTVLDRFRGMRSKERKRAIQFMIWSWSLVALADQLSFTASDLADFAGTGSDAVDRFLEMFEAKQGSIPKGFLLPSPKHTLHRRAIVKQQDDKWFCPVPHKLLWAIKPAIEEVLQKHSVWETYQSHRASFLVVQALSYFKTLLPHAVCEEGLYYPMENGLDAELDALVIFDRYAFIIEGKSGSKTRGVKSDLVGEAAKQAFRARAHIRRSESPRFRRRDGTLIEIDKSRVTSLIAITVSLESLDVFTSELSELRSILSLEEDIWSICLTDLRQIAEIISRSSEFTHYLRWRLRVGDSQDVLGDRDEMNWLGVYLKNGPTAPTPPEGFNMLTFMSHTEDFDNYFMHKLGDRDLPASCPSQHLPQPLPSLLEAIEGSGIFSFTEAAEALLDCTFPERDSLSLLVGKFQADSSKGRAQNIVFEAARWVFLIYSGELTSASLRDAASEMALEKTKSVIGLIVHPREAWQVTGLVIEKCPQV